MNPFALGRGGKSAPWTGCGILQGVPQPSGSWQVSARQALHPANERGRDLDRPPKRGEMSARAGAGVDRALGHDLIRKNSTTTLAREVFLEPRVFVSQQVSQRSDGDNLAPRDGGDPVAGRVKAAQIMGDHHHR